MAAVVAVAAVLVWGCHVPAAEALGIIVAAVCAVGILEVSGSDLVGLVAGRRVAGQGLAEASTVNTPPAMPSAPSAMPLR